MKRESLGNLVWTYPKRKRNARLYFFWAFSKVHKVVMLFLWGLVKIQNAVTSRKSPSSAPAPADRSYIDDGRYDYGLSQPTGYGVKCEQNIEITVRDGTKLRADLYRPDCPGRFPVIMAEAPYPRYQKIHVGVDDNGGVGTKYWYFEQANPEYWVPRGYIYISLSARGYGGSGGHTSVLDYQEIEDYHDAIEWAAEQPWSDGNVGLYGISYYAVSQYWVAGLHPPHLKAIVPWEGLVEPYRDIGYRGGIPCMFSVLFAAGGQIIANNFETRDYLRSFLDNPLFNEIWEYGIGALSRPKDSTPAVRDGVSEIDVPMLSVGNLNDPDLHLQGNVYAFKIARSPYKKLHLYTGTHWGSAYQPWANRTVLRFFDHWLKGIDTGIESEPAVNVELRTGPDTFTHVYGDTWPLEQTQWTKYHLDAEDKTLSTAEPQKESSAEAKYTKDPVAGNSDQITFLTEPLPQDVQVAGPLSAHLWVSSSERDVDLTVEVRDFDENGRETRFAYYIAGMPDEPVTRGWLRTSLRALDPDRTLPHQPYHLFTRNDWLTPGVPVTVDVEIWPTGMLFKAGHRIALTIHCGPHHRPGEVTFSGKLLPFSSRAKDVKAPAYQTFSPESGTTKLYTGGEHSSWLELPVIPVDLAPIHHITIQDRGFTPALTSGGMGDRFEWANSGDDYHSVTESSGLGLWDSQLVRGKRSHNPETWWTEIPWAGTFNYRDEVSGFEGTVEIPDRIAETAATDSKVEVELGIAPPPEGTVFDVQLKAGDDEWKTIHEGIRDARITLDSLPSGSYAVRSRLRRLDSEEPAAASGWSPPTPFDLK